MSIVFIDDVIFNDNNEQRIINYNNCIFFFVINGISIVCELFYLYFYFIIPYYQNKSNFLSLLLNIFHLISNSLYFLLFFEFYLYKPIYLSLTIKIIAMLNPLIIMCIYYWSACLTHNLYVTFYKYNHNMDRRIKLYKYLLFIILIIFYLYTLLNIHYNESHLLSKSFSFMSNYNNSYIEVFYAIGIIIILFILYGLYYIINKNEEFTTLNEYTVDEERKIRTLLLVIPQNISFICYFLITFTPTNIIIIIKYLIVKNNFKSYFIDYIVILLISFFGTFLFVVRLFDPLMRNFIMNFLICNKEFISDYKKKILNEKSLEDILIKEVPQTNNQSKHNIIQNKDNKPKESRKKVSRSYGKLDNIIKSENDNKNLNPKSIYSSNIKRKHNRSNLEMRILALEKFNLEKKVYFKNDNKNKISENKRNSKFIQRLPSMKLDSYKFNVKNNLITKKYQNSISPNINNSKFNFNHSLKPEKGNYWNHSISKKNLNEFHFIKKKNHEHNYLVKSVKDSKKAMNKFYLNLRTKSTFNSNIIKQIIPKKKRSLTKVNEILYHEEISSFALINYHQEITENIIRMIAISISLNECRKYDNNNEYKHYFEETIPWENTSLYTEKAHFKEYNDLNIPLWLGIKNDIRFNNIQFKVKSYAPFVFHHIRTIDKISIDDILSSLDPKKNIKKIKSMKVYGGRGNNSLIKTWDKKIIIKTIEKNERKILTDNMLTYFHCMMKEGHSILSRIYGIFKIKLVDKGSICVILQKNMDDLPIETKLLSFDFKGSTVDRQVIEKGDSGLLRENLFMKYKNKVLKDLDLNILGLKFEINYDKMARLISIIESDSLFLQEFEITDYSLIVFIHEYRKCDLNNSKGNIRIIPSKDKKYIFNFSIVDYLGQFNYEKIGEQWVKKIVGFIKKMKDTNFSVM